MSEARWRVWCLSWDEEEEHDGADVIAYDILQHDYNKRVPRGIVYAPSTTLYDARGAAEAYADYVHSQREGYECTWPLKFRVRDQGGTTTDFEVDREFVPEFTAREVP